MATIETMTPVRMVKSILTWTASTLRTESAINGVGLVICSSMFLDVFSVLDTLRFGLRYLFWALPLLYTEKLIIDNLFLKRKSYITIYEST